MAKKVRVIKSNEPTRWYADYIGEVFSNNTLDELRLKVKVIDDYQDILIDKMNGMHDTTEMLTDDIVLLDERTQPLVEDNTDGLAKELAEEVIKRIREAIE